MSVKKGVKWGRMEDEMEGCGREDMVLGEVPIDDCCCAEGLGPNVRLSGGSLLLLFAGGDTGRDILAGG
jgi:hypothetical protein